LTTSSVSTDPYQVKDPDQLIHLVGVEQDDAQPIPEEGVPEGRVPAWGKHMSVPRRVYQVNYAFN
jgi:hypothetical protein